MQRMQTPTVLVRNGLSNWKLRKPTLCVHKSPVTWGDRNIIINSMINLLKQVLSAFIPFSLFKQPPTNNITLPKMDHLDLDKSVFSPILKSDFLNFRTDRDLHAWRKLSLRFLPESAAEFVRAQNQNDTIVHVFKTRDNFNMTCILPRPYLSEQISIMPPSEEERRVMANAATKALKGFARSTKGCLQITEGWWTYEVCHMKRVRQFHTVTLKEREEMIRKGRKNAPKVGSISSEFLLGRFLPKRAGATDVRFGNVFSVTYRDGDRCRTVDKGIVHRAAEVRFECAENRLAPYFIDIFEDSICHYVLIIGTPALCDIPSFRPRTPPKQAILCADNNAGAKEALSSKSDRLDAARKARLKRLSELVESIDTFPILKQAIIHMLQSEVNGAASDSRSSRFPRQSLLDVFGDLRAQSVPQSLFTIGKETEKETKDEKRVKVKRRDAFQFRDEL